MNTQPIRADWWREVTDPDEVIPAGCPVRREVGRAATEWIEDGCESVRRTSGAHAPRYFRDTRWTPPLPPLKVGDVIETVEDLERLPVGAGVVGEDGDIAQKRWDRLWVYVALGIWGLDSQTMLDGEERFTVLYVPKVGGDDE